MIKLFHIALICISAGFIASCSQVLQSVKLEIDSKDISSQENFNVIAKTLTVKEASAQKYAPYAREVLQSGSGNNASPIPEKLALISEFPKFEPMPQ